MSDKFEDSFKCMMERFTVLSSIDLFYTLEERMFMVDSKLFHESNFNISFQIVQILGRSKLKTESVHDLQLR